MNVIRAHCSLPQAAKELHIPYTTSVELVKKGELPCSWIGKRRIVFIDDLSAYIDRINNYSNVPIKGAA